MLSDDIRRLLYRGNRHMSGRLLDFVTRFCLALLDKGKSVSIVTPNYDDYIAYELHLLIDKVRPSRDFKILLIEDSNPLPAELGQMKGLTCTFLHGFQPRANLLDGLEEALIRPAVFSEPDYFTTYPRSLAVLETLFEHRNLLLIGTGVTDPPLVNALLATRPERSSRSLRRLAMLPLQSSEFSDPSTRLVSDSLAVWNTRRLKELGLVAIYPDFFTQVGQIIHEVQKSMEFGDQDTQLRAVSPRRYGSRLVAWWTKWFAQNCNKNSTQAKHASLLAEQLKDIRAVLLAPLEENLKLEMWVRWRPDNGRELALWASSVGTWSDIWSMRRDTISPRSDYKSVQVFCNGAPTFLHVEPSSPDRWRSYLATPIWLRSSSGDLPVGVISLASMRRNEEGSVGSHNLAALDSVLERMREVGQRIVSVR